MLALGLLTYAFTNCCIGGSNVDDFADRAGAVVSRSAPVVALQPFLGLLPKRGVRARGGGSSCAASGREVVKFIAAMRCGSETDANR